MRYRLLKKIIPFINQMDSESSTVEQSDDMSRFNDRQREAWQEAQWVESQTGIPADYIYRQWAHESGNFESRLAKENNNFGGLTQTTPNGEDNKQPDGGNYYRQYDNMHEYAESYVNDFINRYDGKENIKSMEDFVNFLYDNGYFTADPADYLASMQGIDAPTGRTSSNRQTSSVNTVNNDTVDDNSLYEGFAREQLEASRNAEDVDFFGGFFENGNFKNTEENIAKIRERAHGDLSEEYEDYVNRQKAKQKPVQERQGKSAKNAPSIETKADNLDAVRQKLKANLEDAITRGDLSAMDTISSTIRSGNASQMKQLADSLPDIQPMNTEPVQTASANAEKTEARQEAAPQVENVAPEATMGEPSGQEAQPVQNEQPVQSVVPQQATTPAQPKNVAPKKPCHSQYMRSLPKNRA